ncbi:PREDICTED: uncharacterized protein LOC105113976 [Populus euphratica]|uniref:Uncharacterized protein LOC105113976 n=1 Tax=Populus euphratica TaxID=75702 RepID=A0AAJ6TD14_POPEU|nr:PREDICTED: uncharacterized protein LOC105113976 [Populus euphratica]
MVRVLMPDHVGHHIEGSVPLAIGLFISVSVLVALCAKHSIWRTQQKHQYSCAATSNSKCATPNKSPLASPKKLGLKISKRAIPSLDRKKDGADDEDSTVPGIGIKEEAGGLEEGGLWQKSILMGEKCQPPEFSGVIFYDGHGNQLSQMPRSPRASPLPSISFPAVKDAN